MNMLSVQGRAVSRQDELFDLAVRKLHEARYEPIRPCKICGGEAAPFDILDFNKSCEASRYPLGFRALPVVYRKCGECAFIFTDFFDEFSGAQWRSHIYNDEYIKVDPEYRDIRPRINARTIVSILKRLSDPVIGLDYGGGNGDTAALVRRQGWDYDTYDPFGHVAMAPENKGAYNFCTAFEVFEHTPDPVGTLETLLDMASPEKLFIYFSTTLHDGAVTDASRLSWWYAGPRNGHISLYSRKSLQVLASRFGLTYHAIRREMGNHILARGVGAGRIASLMERYKYVRKARSLLGLKTPLFS